MALKGETLATGAAKTCDDCGVTPKLDVYMSAAGYYVGTYCNCGPYSRESRYYDKRSGAQAALDTGIFGRPTEYGGTPW